MGFLPKNPFAKKQETPTPSEDVIIRPKMPARDEHGKFISKKKKVAVPISTQDEQKPTPSKIPSQIKPQIITFYGCDIRKFYDESWYFSLLDILSLAKIINPSENLLTIKRKPETKKIFAENVRVFEDIEAISYEGFMQLLPILRSNDTLFPGPFPDWLQTQSKYP